MTFKAFMLALRFLLLTLGCHSYHGYSLEKSHDGVEEMGFQKRRGDMGGEINLDVITRTLQAPMCRPKGDKWGGFCANKCSKCPESYTLQKTCRKRCVCNFSQLDQLECRPKGKQMNEVKNCVICESKPISNKQCSNNCDCVLRENTIKGETGCQQQGGCQAKPSKKKWNYFCRKKCKLIKSYGPNTKCSKRCKC